MLRNKKKEVDNFVRIAIWPCDMSDLARADKQDFDKLKASHACHSHSRIINNGHHNTVQNIAQLTAHLLTNEF